jgi:hypothetical protein
MISAILDIPRGIEGGGILGKGGKIGRGLDEGVV